MRLITGIKALDLHDRIGKHCAQAINETQNAEYGWGYEHVRVKPEPGEVESDLHAEVVVNVIQRLVSNPILHFRPLVVQKRPLRSVVHVVSVVQRISAYVSGICQKLIDSNAVEIVFCVVGEGRSLENKVDDREPNEAGEKVLLVEVEQVAFVARELMIEFVASLRENSLVETDSLVNAIEH